MTTTKVDGEAPAFFFFLMVSVCLLRRHIKAVARPFRRRLSALLLVERAGSCARGDRYVGGGEAEITGGSGEEVEDAEHDVAP